MSESNLSGAVIAPEGMVPEAIVQGVIEREVTAREVNAAKGEIVPEENAVSVAPRPVLTKPPKL